MQRDDSSSAPLVNQIPVKHDCHFGLSVGREHIAELSAVNGPIHLELQPGRGRRPEVEGAQKCAEVEVNSVGEVGPAVLTSSSTPKTASDALGRRMSRTSLVMRRSAMLCRAMSSLSASNLPLALSSGKSLL